MIDREAGLVEIYERLKANRVTLGVKTFKRNPTEPIVAEDLPCIFMIENDDVIIKRSSRKITDPKTRKLDTSIELVTSDDVDIKTLFLAVRKVIFTERDSDPAEYSTRVTDTAFIDENRTEGPLGYGLPNVLGMALHLDLVYKDVL